MALNKNIFNNKKVLITGGAGFIGSSLAHVLVGFGAEVTILDAMLPLYGGNLFNLDGIKEKIKFITGDIRDKDLMLKIVVGQDYIFNLAAQVSYIDSKSEPFLDLDINCLGHMTVLEAIREMAPNARVIFSSSRMVYGKIHTTPVREDHSTEPLSLYGIHKLTAEKYYRYYHDMFGLDTLVVRIPNPYGPRQQMKHNKYSIVGWFLRQALNEETITIFGEGAQERDYLYIDDVVDGLLRVAEKGLAGEVYNLGIEERVTLVEMIDVVLKEVGTGNKEHIPWPENYEKNETGGYIADTSKVERGTGWKATTPLKEGVKRMVAYYRNYKEHYID
ncbi:NAD-dependent epimerase/dehydratase family protein [bacterium]|jgi:UDP-glucose 4-epimerase|nr:NAD-dependent epimerase/dehydratase family protein [Candidatus Woesearchaeota archaeon]MBT4732734.1 NAD-dependent epimerase/dehydratase family protein [Candidatus Woesearchaeota archaeon]MBT4894463.1 NAD-dependent epimerase/dehydratase family protein [bacterium]MBT6048108.1 NAD-dependent epimerase/dehydratase family protein [Candidatus Scalindua sp.]